MSATRNDEAFENLHHLIKKGNLSKVRAWVASGGDVNLDNRYGWSLLMLAALHGRTDIAQMLLAAGANPAVKNKFGDTASGLARHKGFNRTARIMSRQWPMTSDPVS